MSDNKTNEIALKGFVLDANEDIPSFYPEVNKNGVVVAVRTNGSRKDVSYEGLRKQVFARR